MVQQVIQALVGNLGGLRPPTVATPQSRQPTQRPFKSHVGVLDGDGAFDTVAEVAAIVDAQVAGGDDDVIWRMTVPAQQKIRWGFGTPAFPANQGYMFFVALDVATGFQEGVLTLQQRNARGTRVETVLEINTESLHLQVATTLATATPTSREDMIALPEKIEFDVSEEDDILQLLFRTTLVTTTVDSIGMIIPITIYQ